MLSLAKVNEPYLAQLQAAAARVIASGRYVGGEEVEAFETELAAMHGPDAIAIGVSNGLDALRLIWRAHIALGRLNPGDEVIVPANTFIATVLAITDAGLKPVLIDPDPDTHNITSAAVRRALTPRTRAIAPVHLYGRAAWDDEMCSLARELGLVVIEDNAQALGAHAATVGLDGKSTVTGRLGHAAGISFYPTKNIGALGDAGAVVTADAELADAIRALHNYGSDRRYHNIYAGYNCRLDALQAALLRVKLPHLDAENAHRQHLAAIYATGIDSPVVINQSPDRADKDVWHQYVIRVTGGHRDDLQRHLAQQDIDTDVHYPVPIHRQPCYAVQFASATLPVADMLASQVLSLPMGNYLTEADVQRVCQAINNYNPE